jgi:hypothetical protein
MLAPLVGLVLGCSTASSAVDHMPTGVNEILKDTLFFRSPTFPCMELVIGKVSITGVTLISSFA